MTLLDFEDVIRDASSGNAKVQKGAYLSAGKFPIIDQGQDFIGGFTNEAENLVTGQGPWIVFGDHTRALKFIEFPFCMGADGVKVLRLTNDKIADLKYVYHFLVSANIPSAGYSRHYKFLKRLQIPLPPLDEQKRIAAILDKADQLRQKRRQAIALLDSLTQSIFLEMFGEHDPTGTDSTLLGIADIQIGYPFKSERYTEASDGIKLCRGANILPNKMDWSDLAKWPFDQATNHADFALKENDIVVAMDRPWISTGFKIASITSDDLPALLVQRVARIRAKKKSDAYFIYELMRGSAFTRHCRPTETTIPHISPKDFRSFQFNSGRDSDRRAFSERAQHIYATKDKLDQQAKYIDGLFASLQHRAFSGQL